MLEFVEALRPQPVWLRTRSGYLCTFAPFQVAADVRKCLGIPLAVELRSATNRANLHYAVRLRPKTSADAIQSIIKIVKQFPAGTPGIVYCITRKEAEQIDAAMRSAEDAPIESAFYHADLTAEARERVHSRWMEGHLAVVVATVAFGMGINKADVRFVIHAGLPSSLHHYYQEAGRAGRDGEAALCVLMYRPSDVMRHSVMNYWKPGSLRELYSMARYCHASTCRRASLARAFGEAAPPCAKGCDVCAAAAGPE
eukprot:6456149-Amphidinium_carterae.1